MADVQKHAPGTFCWVELGTTDRVRAAAFYADLFGWEMQEVPAGPTTYTMMRKNGKDVGGMYELSPEMRAQQVPPHWLSYVAVESADAAARQAATLGGKVMMDAMDVMDVGRMAVVQDPTGATLALWQAKKHQGAGAADEPGTVCWTELATPDKRAAASFYKGMFDWDGHEQQFGPMPYTTWMHGETPAGGMYEPTPDMPAMPPHWMPYFKVDDCDATAARATKAGGTVMVGPQDIPTIGRFALVQDPTGAMFSVIKVAEM